MLPSVKSTDSSNILASNWLAWRWNCNLAYQMEYFSHSRDVCPVPIWEWRQWKGLERGWTSYCTHATWEFFPPIHFQVNFDSFDGYILTGWNFLDLALKMTLQHDLQSLWPDCLARQSQWCWITNVAKIPLIQWFHLHAEKECKEALKCVLIFIVCLVSSEKTQDPRLIFSLFNHLCS